MAIFPHSDDETVVSPILSKYAKEGVDVYFVLVTDGSMGATSHANIPAGDSLTAVRKIEATGTTEALGIHPPIFLDYLDGNLNSWEDLYSLDDQIDSLFKAYQPDVVITWGPDGGYGHPDHRAVSNIITEVYQKGEHDYIKRLLYSGITQEAIDLAHEPQSNDGKYFKANFHPTQKSLLNYRIKYSQEDYTNGLNALYCCKSQFTREAMNDLYRLLHDNTDHTIYLREWNGSDGIKTCVFD